jgi:DNA-binding NarL/FixJ family response regulator
VARRLIAAYTARPVASAVPPSARLDVLTARERETLLHLARGLSNAEIAAALVVSEHTVKTHVGHVLSKLGLRDRIQAVICAYEYGLVSPSPEGEASPFSPAQARRTHGEDRSPR